jgi:predicted component of type VI protein secretion system
MQPSPILKLTMRQGPRPNQVFELYKEVHTIGREAGNDILINDPQVSRHHARLTLQDSQYLLEDLGSTNGSYINGRRVTEPVLIAAGDMLGLGDTIVLSVTGPVDAGATQVARPPIPAATPAPAPQHRPMQAEPAEALEPITGPTTSGLSPNTQRAIVIGCAGLALVALICVLGVVAWSFLDCPSFREFWRTLPILGGISIGC